MSHMTQTPPPHEELTLVLPEQERPTLLTEALRPAELRRAELKRRFLDGLRQSGTISKAAAHAGISRRTAQRWQQDDPEFAAEVTRWLHEDQADELHETMFEIVKLGRTDPKYATAAVKAGEFLLKALDRDTYGDQLRTESTLTINAQMQIADSALDLLRKRQADALAQFARTIDAPALPRTE